LLCKSHTFFEKLEDIQKPFICGCLQKPVDKDTWKVCSTCFHGSWWNKNLFRKFECPFCKSESKENRKSTITIRRQPWEHDRPIESFNSHDLYKRKKTKEEAKRRAERVELADLIAQKLSKKLEPEIIANELGEDK